MEKLFIVGIDTLAGSNLAATLADRCNIDGAETTSMHRDPQGIAVLAAIAVNQPTWIVYCGPTTRSAWDWADEPNWNVETSRVRAIAAAAESCGARFTLISTDAAYDGPRIFSREEHSVGDSSTAVAVRQFEDALVGSQAFIVRTHLFGWSPSGNSYVEALTASLTDGRSFHACDKKYASPILASDFSNLLWLAHRKRLQGTFHLAGAERTSQRQFAMKLAVASGNTFGPMSRTIANAIPEICEHQACETSLDSRAIQHELQSPLPLSRAAIDRFVEQATNGYRDRLAEFQAASLAGVAA